MDGSIVLEVEVIILFHGNPFHGLYKGDLFQDDTS